LVEVSRLCRRSVGGMILLEPPSEAMNNIPTNLLRAFVMVIDLKGFTKAGEELGRTQPTISLQIKRLQEMIGITLFERDSGVAQLTEAGEICASYARKILALHDEMMNRLTLHGAGNRLRIGLPSDYADQFMSDFLSRVDAEALDIRFEVVCDLSINLLAELREGAIDLVVANTDRVMNGAVATWSEKLAWVGSPGRSHSVGGNSDRPFPLVAAPEGCMYRRAMLSVLAREGRVADVVYTTPSLTGIEAAVRAGFGVTAMAERLVPPALTILRDLPPLPDLPAGIYLNSRAQNRQVRRLATLLADAMADTQAAPLAVGA
jgi:DNA-binding transcriptional LysR family regulator